MDNEGGAWGEPLPPHPPHPEAISRSQPGLPAETAFWAVGTMEGQDCRLESWGCHSHFSNTLAYHPVGPSQAVRGRPRCPLSVSSQGAVTSILIPRLERSTPQAGAGGAGGRTQEGTREPPQGGPAAVAQAEKYPSQTPPSSGWSPAPVLKACKGGITGGRQR